VAGLLALIGRYRYSVARQRKEDSSAQRTYQLSDGGRVDGDWYFDRQQRRAGRRVGHCDWLGGSRDAGGRNDPGSDEFRAVDVVGCGGEHERCVGFLHGRGRVRKLHIPNATSEKQEALLYRASTGAVLVRFSNAAAVNVTWSTNGLVGSDDQDSGKYQVREPRPARASLMSSLVNKPQNDAPECAIEVSGIENQPMSLWG